MTTLASPSLSSCRLRVDLTLSLRSECWLTFFSFWGGPFLPNSQRNTKPDQKFSFLVGITIEANPPVPLSLPHTNTLACVWCYYNDINNKAGAIFKQKCGHLSHQHVTYLPSFAPIISQELCDSGVKAQPNYRPTRWPSRSPTPARTLAHACLLTALSITHPPSLTGSAPELPPSPPSPPSASPTDSPKQRLGGREDASSWDSGKRVASQRVTASAVRGRAARFIPEQDRCCSRDGTLPISPLVSLSFMR